MNEDAARHALDDATRKARAYWEEYKSDPNYFVPGTTWSSWVIQNQPQLHALADMYNMAVSATNMATLQAYGGMAQQYIQHKQDIRAAIDSSQFYPG